MEVTIINDDGKYTLAFQVNNKLLQRVTNINHSEGYNTRMYLIIDLWKFFLVSFQYSSIKVTNTLISEPGTFEFAKPSLLFKESAGKALIPVERSNGADGKVTVGWRTEDMSAHSPVDYEGGEGTIIFEHGEMTKMLEINIHDDQAS